MNFPDKFYRATDEYCTYEKHVNAPYIRRVFDAPKVKKATITIACPGFYDLFLNGRKITKGLLAPYIANPDDYVYCDRYDVTDMLKRKSNVIGIILGNGIQNCPGGRVWDFDTARFRNVPCFAASITYTDDKGRETEITADESFRCAPSPIIFDDLRSGCFYDANLEKDWLSPDFDDSGWDNIKPAEMPRGEIRLCEADPIVITEEIRAVEIKEAVLDKRLDNRENMRLDTQFRFNKGGKKGILFDFGINTAGIFRLRLDGKPGQKIFIQFCEYVTSKGEPSYTNTGSFYPDGYGQTAYYICKGCRDEGYEPSFTYIGYRYAWVSGLEKDQIKDDTLVMLRANSALESRGSFTCSDEAVNTLIRMGNTSDLANFYYFPTDCPHREKNGWTGDAAVSSEHMLLTLTPEKSYREWLRNICRSQLSDGQLPGIVPTSGWGYEWGNGPAWDNVLTELCWQIYRMRGDLTPAKECSESILRYLSYISQKRRPDGLIAIGLGDWLQPLKNESTPTAPLYLTDSVISMYICRKSADLFRAMGLEYQYNFALSLCNSFRDAIRRNCIDFSLMAAKPYCQTAQAICIYYGVFDECEKQAASDFLVKLVHEKDDHFDCGMIGMRVIFHVLSACNESDLAYRMITRRDFPSYGMFIERGYTAMAECFLPDEKRNNPYSLNHHFMGDITSWFIQCVAGIRVNPRFTSPDDFDIAPAFIESLTCAKAHYDAPCGTVSAEWKRQKNGILLKVKAPKKATGYITLPFGFVFADKQHPDSAVNGSSCIPLAPGNYIVVNA